MSRSCVAVSPRWCRRPLRRQSDMNMNSVVRSFSRHIIEKEKGDKNGTGEWCCGSLEVALGRKADTFRELRDAANEVNTTNLGIGNRRRHGKCVTSCPSQPCRRGRRSGMLGARRRCPRSRTWRGKRLKITARIDRKPLRITNTTMPGSAVDLRGDSEIIRRS